MTFDPDASIAAYQRQWRHGYPVKITEDLDRYDRILNATRPELVIETGTHQGHSAVWFADHDIDVVTIDIVSAVGPGQAAHPRITWLLGSSTDPAIIEQVIEHATGRRTMVALDSAHTAGHVAAEIELYGPLVTTGCYLVVEDGICRWLDHDPHRVAGPLDAIESLLIGAEAWERDIAIEHLHPATMSPAGWWRRKEATVG